MEDKAEKNRALVAELEDGEWRAGGVGGKQVSEIMFCFFCLLFVSVFSSISNTASSLPITADWEWQRGRGVSTMQKRSERYPKP